MAKFDPIMDVIESLCIRSGDPLMRNKALYLDVAEDVWDEMNQSVLRIQDTVKMPVRRTFRVDKRTNRLVLPANMGRISAINSIDRYGCYYPLYRNDNIPEDLVDLGAAQDCACENKCSSRLCNTVKGYEAVVTVKTDKMPDDTDVEFTCTDKKIVDSQGFLYEQTQYPLRVYTDGVWTDTVLHTEDKKLCEVEVDENCCICDTEANLATICEACGIQPESCCSNDSSIVYGGNSTTPPCTDATTWIYQCASRMEWFSVQCGGYAYRCSGAFNNIYNISQDGKTLIFPSNFGYENIMIRSYQDIDLQNLQIPVIAKDCFMTGLQAYTTRHHDDKQQLALLYERKFGKQMWGLSQELNKYRIAELAQIFAPQVFVPSYLNNNRYYNNYRGY